MSMLFSPIQIGPLTLPNRIVIPPMCTYSAKAGLVQDWHLMHYGQMAFSGAGMLIVEVTAVDPAGRITDRELGLWSDAAEQSFAGLLRSIRAHSSMPVAVQLGHAGRKGSQQVAWLGGRQLPFSGGGWQTVAPSAMPFNADDLPPEALSVEAIKGIVRLFAQAAERAGRAGFDCVEMHAAHGYLLHQFLSPLSNVRSDAYGGSLENRMRLPLEIFEAMRAAFPADRPVGARLSATDWMESGWTVEESIELTKELKRRGCAYISVSSGGLAADQQVRLGPGYQVEFAAKIKAATGLSTIAVGLITEAPQAEQILISGQADMVALGRAMLYNPHWPWQAAAQLGDRVTAPPQYWRSAPSGVKNLFQ